MNLNRCTYFAIPLLAVGITLNVSAQQSMPDIQNGEQDAAMSPELSNKVMPQIVRLSYVQGDVRFSRGDVDRHDGGTVWEQAAVNLPLQTGFSLVTGNGRAEIEFEDASTVYLGENSVLTFDNLTTKEDVPHTEMALLTGVATLHLDPDMRGESYFIKTPTDTLHVGFGGRTDLRVNSYLDAVGLTPVQPPVVPAAQAKTIAAELGTTYIYRAGVRLSTTHPAMDHFAEWDHWVANRFAAREKAMAVVMGEAGLATPLPGLADMNAKGRFFRCEPYGTCWEPNSGWGGAKAGDAAGAGGGTQAARVEQTGMDKQSSPTAQATPAQQATGAQQPSGKQRPSGNQTPAASWGYGSVPMGMYDAGFDFPCSPYGFGDGFMDDADLMSAEYSTMGGGPMFGYGYDWAVCHAGSWIPYGRSYAWVVSGKRHHHCPVQWIKTGHRLAYVPIHPKDVVGKTPLNLKHGLYVEVGRKDHTFERTRLDASAEMKVLRGTPRSFRRPGVPVLPAAAAPTVAAHEWNEGLASVKAPLTAGGKTPLAAEGKAALAARPVNTIAYDHRSQTFNLVTQVTERGRTNTFTNPMGGPVGSPQTGGSMLAGGYRGAAAGTGFRGGYSRGATSASSGFRGSSGGGSVSSGASAGGGASMGGASPAGGPATAGGGGGHPR